MRLIENDDALEVSHFTALCQPGHDLLQTVDARLHPVFLARLAFERVVAREADAFGPLDRSLAGAEVEDEVGRAAERGPVADGVAQEAPVLAHPEGAAAALEHVVEEDRGRGPAFPDSGAIAEEEPLTWPDRLPGTRQLLAVSRTRPDDGFELGVREEALGYEVLGERRAVVALGCRGRRHRRRLDEARRVGARAGHPDARTVGVEHARRERARLGAVPSGLDRQWERAREGPRKHRLAPVCRVRPRTRERVAQAGDAGCEKGEEVELFDLGSCRACCDV